MSFIGILVICFVLVESVDLITTLLPSKEIAQTVHFQFTGKLLRDQGFKEEKVHGESRKPKQRSQKQILFALRMSEKFPVTPVDTEKAQNFCENQKLFRYIVGTLLTRGDSAESVKLKILSAESPLKVKTSKLIRVVLNLRADYSVRDLLKCVDKMSVCLCKTVQTCTLRNAMSLFMKCQLYKSGSIGPYKVPWSNRIPSLEIINMRKVLKDEGLGKLLTDVVDCSLFESEFFPVTPTFVEKEKSERQSIDLF
jgi:hypothetical protein